MTDWRRTRHIGLDRDTIDRAARIYADSKCAAEALGVHQESFRRLCRKHGIETPGQRRKREWAAYKEQAIG